jgi:hypothetical protein
LADGGIGHSRGILFKPFPKKNSMEPKDDQLRKEEQQRSDAPQENQPKQRITHNLDTGEDEVLPDINDENIMDFGSGSGGGSASDGGSGA